MRTIGPVRTALLDDALTASRRRAARVTASGLTISPSADVREAEEASHVLVQRPSPELVRRRDLHDAAGSHHGDAVAERERLRLIVRDVDGRQRELVEQPREVVEQAVSKPAVERPERLVEKEDARLGCERSRERDALLLASRERADRAALESGEADELEQLGGARLRLLRRVAAHPQAERRRCRTTSRCGKSA